MDGKAGCFEHAPGIVALAANDVGHRDLFGALRYRVGDGVAPVQDGALCGLLRDDLALCDRVGERFGGRCGEAESFDRLLRGVRAHPVEGGYGERFASLGQDDVDGRVVRYRGTGRRGLGDDLSLWYLLGVGVRDCAEGQACVGECLLRIVLGLAAHVGYGFHVDTLGHVELHVGSLMDRGSTLRVGASDGTGCDVVRKLLLDGEGQPHRAQIGLNVCEGAPIGGGHRQVGAGAVFGPPPGASNSRHREEEDDQAHPQGCTLVCCRRARLLGRWDRRRGVDRCDG